MKQNTAVGHVKEKKMLVNRYTSKGDYSVRDIPQTQNINELWVIVRKKGRVFHQKYTTKLFITVLLQSKAETDSNDCVVAKQNTLKR